MNAARMPATSGRRVVRALERAGFVVDRIVDSHHVLTMPGDPARTVTVPLHGGKDLKPGTLRSIISPVRTDGRGVQRPPLTT